MSVSTRVEPGDTQEHLPLRAARLQRGLSLADAAVLAKMDIGHLSRLERGLQVPNVDTLYRLAGVLKLRQLRAALRPYVGDQEQPPRRTTPTP